MRKFPDQFCVNNERVSRKDHSSPKFLHLMIDAAKALEQRVVRLVLVPGWMRGCEARL
jgi:hypothetical protein